ncbi:MAG: ACT domain-containing protein, partial [Sedimenticola sp.]|nr:ACT domain-containing protein [Sedimenticola sp.]
IVAIFNPGKGIVVHRHECRNLGDFRKSDSWLDVNWEENPVGDFTTEIKVDVGNKRGALASVASAISELGSNIKNVVMEERDGLTSTLHFIVAVDSRKHLANIMRRVRQLKTVLRIHRVG